MCLDIDPGPNSDPRIGRIGRIGRFGGSAGSVENDSASYLPISLKSNTVASYSANGELSGELSVSTGHWVSARPSQKTAIRGSKGRVGRYRIPDRMAQALSGPMSMMN